MASTNSTNPFATAFTIASVERTAGGSDIDPVTRIRNKFTEAIDFQLALVTDQKATKKVRQYVDGERKEVGVPIKPWWFEVNGNTYTTVKYGSKNVALDGTKKHIQVSSGAATKKQLTDTFNKLKTMCANGELDAVLRPYAAKPGKKTA